MDVDVIFAPCDFRLSQVYVFFTVMDPGFDFYNKGGGGVKIIDGVSISHFSLCFCPVFIMQSIEFASLASVNN